METGLPGPILRSGVVIKLTTVGAVRLIDVKGFKSAVFVDEDSVPVVDRYCRRTQHSMREAFVVKIGYSRCEAVCPRQKNVAAFVFLE